MVTEDPYAAWRARVIQDHEGCAPDKKQKASYVGAPKIFLLNLECKHLTDAFGNGHCYLVGSALSRPDWRDVDVVCILDDAKFYTLFPKVPRNHGPLWELDARWLLFTTAISERLSRITRLPIDFKFQPQTHANAMHPGERDPLGLVLPSLSSFEVREKPDLTPARCPFCDDSPQPLRDYIQDGKKVGRSLTCRCGVCLLQRYADGESDEHSDAHVDQILIRRWNKRAYV